MAKKKITDRDKAAFLKSAARKMTAKKQAAQLDRKKKTPVKDVSSKKMKTTPKSGTKTGTHASGTPGSSDKKGRPLTVAEKKQKPQPQTKKEKKAAKDQERIWSLVEKGKKKAEREGPPGSDTKKGGSKNRDGKRDGASGTTGSSHIGERLNKWKPKDMQIAVYTVLEDRKKPVNKRIGIRRIAEACNVPRNTLNQRVLGRVSGFQHKSGGELSAKLFSEEEEQELVNMALKHADSGFPFTPKKLRNLAFEFALMQGHTVNNKHEELSRTWIKRFNKRHPELALHVPQQLSSYRAI